MASIKDLLQGLSGYFTGSTQGLLYQREQARQNVEQQLAAMQNTLNIERTREQLEASRQARGLAAEAHIAQGLNMTPQQRADFDLANLLAANEATFRQGLRQGIEQEDVIAQRLAASTPRAIAALGPHAGTLQMLPYGTQVARPQIESEFDRSLQPLIRREAELKVEGADLSLAQAAETLLQSRAKFQNWVDFEAPLERTLGRLQAQEAIWKSEEAELMHMIQQANAGLLSATATTELQTRLLKLAHERDNYIRFAAFNEEMAERGTPSFYETPGDLQAYQDRVALERLGFQQQAQLRRIPSVQITGYDEPTLALKWAQTMNESRKLDIEALATAAEVAPEGTDSAAGIAMAKALSEYRSRLDAADTDAKRQRALEQFTIDVAEIRQRHPQEDLDALGEQARQLLSMTAPPGQSGVNWPAAGTEADPFASGLYQGPDLEDLGLYPMP